MTEFDTRLDELEARLASIEAHAAGNPRGLAGMMRELLPTEARTHLRAARKEQLLAARAFLDHWIERLEKEPADRLPRRETISFE
jgi:hypothetical protein